MFGIIDNEDNEEIIELKEENINSFNETSIKTIEKAKNGSKLETKCNFEHKTYDIRSYFQTLDTNKPTNSQTITREVDKNAEKFIKKQKFIMTENRSSLKLLKTDNKSREIEKSTKVSDSSNGSQSSPQKMRLWIPKSGINSSYKLISISPSNRIQLNLESEEPESDLISDDQYFRYLGLISSQKTSSTAINWPLRKISCLKCLPKRSSDGNIILTDICPKPLQSLPETNSSSKVNENSCEVSRRKLAKHQWLEEVRDNTQNLSENQKQIDKQKNEIEKKRAKELREWKKDTLNLISSFDISSFMGKRIFRSLFEMLTDLDKYLLIINCENYCLNNLFNYLSQSSVNLNNSSNTISRISRNRNGIDWNPRNYQFNYCFNRRQRLDKWKRMETGLDWKSRILKSHCKRLYVKMKKIINCPLCSQTIDNNHQCYEWEKNMTEGTDDSDLKRQSNDEIIIIEDDFNQHLLKNNSRLSHEISDESSSNSDMNCDQEVNDVIFIDEVVVQNDTVFKMKQKCAENEPVITFCDLSQNISILKSRPLQTSNDLNRDSVTEHSYVQKNSYIESKEFVFGSNLFKN